MTGGAGFIASAVVWHLIGGSKASVLNVDKLTYARIEQKPQGLNSFRELIRFVADRPGHDQCYAIDASKIEATLGWTPVDTFESGLSKTVDWFLANETWWQRVRSGAYQGERLGLL